VLVIDGLAVDPDRQGLGIARQLVDAAVAEARRRGARRVTLRVLGHNTGARRVYEHCGFVVEGVLRGEFRIDGEDVDDVLMARSLA
jgi:ribosomal protein S18 acetylase RimI-like enzyme